MERKLNRIILLLNNVFVITNNQNLLSIGKHYRISVPVDRDNTLRGYIVNNTIRRLLNSQVTISRGEYIQIIVTPDDSQLFLLCWLFRKYKIRLWIALLENAYTYPAFPTGLHYELSTI
jgi:hypothetical protein